MAVKTVPGIKKMLIPFNGGLNEVAPVTKLPIEDYMELDNWRLSEDGTRLVKKGGTSAVLADSSITTDIYGVSAYSDEDDAFCYLKVHKDLMRRKTGTGAWSTLYSWEDAHISHPVHIIQVQGKNYVITDVENRFIHTDKNDYQVGIDAPITLPSASITGPTITDYLDDDCSTLTGWTEDNDNDGDVTQVTFDEQETLKFDCPADGASGPFNVDRARIHRTVGGGYPDSYVIEIKAHHDNIGTVANEEHVEIEVWNGVIKVHIRIDPNSIDVYDGAAWNSKTIFTDEDIWYTYKFIVDGSVGGSETVEVFRDGVTYGTLDCSDADAATDGKVQISTFSGSAKAATTNYADYIKIYTQTGATAGVLTGDYRYAVKFARGGNFGNEGNPLKSILGAASFTGTGLNDVTSGGVYTGSEDITTKVEIDTTGTPDTVKISYDGGTTWHTSSMPVSSTMYLNYGIELTWDATTGHTAADYWEVVCVSCAITAAAELVNLDNIPTSTDPQVDQRILYRTAASGTIYYRLMIINDNTTTSFVDNLPDAALGLTMTEDHDVCPNGRFAEWWDDRMWVVDVANDIIYYSKKKNGESYDEANRYVLVRRGDDSEIRGIKAYKDNLYVFTNEAIYIIVKYPSGYGRFLVTDGVGCVAGHSIVIANNLLFFLSYRGLELFNGENLYTLDFSTPVKRTIDKITAASRKYITSVHHRGFSEIWWAFPDNSDSEKYIIVYNYVYGKWFRFKQSKDISYMKVFRASNDTEALGLFTRDGLLGHVESSAQDFGVNITATARKGWIDLGMYCDTHKFELEYESPTSKDLTLNFYVNFQTAVVRTATISGDSPGATDTDMRRPIKTQVELGIRCRYFNFELINSDATAGDCKINNATLWYRPKKMAAEIKGD